MVAKVPKRDWLGALQRLWVRHWRDWFFLAVLLLFVIEASWIAIHSAFPMAFDEGYHFRLIQFFAGHPNPIVTSQDPSTYGLGNIVHNSSWLYHWLLSFPYRLLALSHSQYVEVVGLRFLNIGLAVCSLLLLHRLLRHFRLDSAIRTFVVLLFCLTPVVTALSAQINYDNLVLLLSLGVMYYVLYFVRELRAGKPSGKTLAKLLIVSLAGTLVKFSFLPIVAGTAVVTGAAWYINRRRAGVSLSRVWQSFRGLPALTRSLLAVGVLLSAGLFGLFYGQNLVRYHNLTPSCDQVLSISACSNYYAWERNYELAESRDPAMALQGPLTYAYHWLTTSWYHLYAEIVPTGGIVHIATSFYILLLNVTALAVLVTLVSIRKVLRRNPLLLPMLGLSSVYVLGLWLRNYHDYRHLGEAVAVQGRYLVPVLAYYYLVLVLGVHEFFTSSNTHRQCVGRRIEIGAAVFVAAMFIWYGGAVRYLSDILPESHWQEKTAPSVAVSGRDTHRTL